MTAEPVDTTVINARISRSVRVLMAARHLNTKQLAAAIGMSEDTLGRRLAAGGWRFDEVLLVASHLDVAVAYLYETDPENWFRPDPETRALQSVIPAVRKPPRRPATRATRRNKAYCSTSSPRIRSGSTRVAA